MKSTPRRLVEIMRLTALLPPPPTPMTLMLAPTALVSSKEILGAIFGSRSSMRIISASSKKGSLEQLAEPAFEHLAHARKEERVRGLERRLLPVPRSVEREAHHGAELRRAHGVGQAADLLRGPGAPHGRIEDVLGDLRDPLEHRAAAGQGHAGMDRAIETAPRE